MIGETKCGAAGRCIRVISHSRAAWDEVGATNRLLVIGKV